VQSYRVTKVIEFSYGHRLLGHAGKCRHLHGHNGLLEVDVATETLDRLGMVVDFGDLSDVVKTWVNDHLDHRTLLRKDDPLTPLLIGQGEPIFVMEVNPTAENIARLIAEAARERGLNVSEVRLWETATSRATYRPDLEANEGRS